MINILARLKYLPILLIVCYIYPSITKVKYSITGNHKLIEDQISDTFINLHGLLNFYFYGCDPEIWIYLRKNEKKEN